MHNIFPAGVTAGSTVVLRNTRTDRSYRVNVTEVITSGAGTTAYRNELGAVFPAGDYELVRVVELAYYGRPAEVGTYEIYAPRRFDPVGKLTLDEGDRWTLSTWGIPSAGTQVIAEEDTDRFVDKLDSFFARGFYIRRSRPSYLVRVTS